MGEKALLLPMVFTLLISGVVLAAPPMPNDLQMVEPDPALPKELRDFWGKWQGGTFLGRFPANRLDFFVIVEKIGEKNANLYFWSSRTDKWERILDAEVVKDGSEYKIRFRVLVSSIERVNELSLKKDGKMELYLTDIMAGYNTVMLKRVP
jgi:hypothetical protein